MVHVKYSKILSSKMETQEIINNNRGDTPAVNYFELVNNIDLWPNLFRMLDTKSLWRLRQTSRIIKISVDDWTTNRQMDWPFFSNLMLESDHRTNKNKSTELQYIVISQDNTKLAILVDFDKNYLHRTGDISTRSKVCVYDIHKGKIAEFIANNETKPIFSCDGTILVAGAPVPYKANPPLADSFGIIVCDLLNATSQNMATPFHHFKRKHFLNVHFITSDFIWCDQRNTTQNPNGQRHIGFRLWRNRNGRVVRSSFKRDEARFSFRDEHSWIGSTHAIQLIANPSTKTIIEYYGSRINRPYPNASMTVVKLNNNREVIASQTVRFWGPLSYSAIEISRAGDAIMVVNKASLDGDNRDLARIALYKLADKRTDFISPPRYIRGRALTFPRIQSWRNIPPKPKIWRFDGKWMVFSHSDGSSCQFSCESPCSALVTDQEEHILHVDEGNMGWSPSMWNIILNGNPGDVWPSIIKDESMKAVNIERLYKSY